MVDSIKKTILIVVAHPDDEVLGCGGTILRIAKEGMRGIPAENIAIYTLILGVGKDSRGTVDTDFNEEKNVLRSEAKRASQLMGCENVYFGDFPDNKFDAVPLLDVVKFVNQVKLGIKPDIIFTHFRNDLNVDHRVTYNAVLTATRPIEGETVKELYSFEVLSSTEWNYPLSFSPNYFVDITKQIEGKQNAMQAYDSELREYPHPRSLEGIKLNAKYWAARSGIAGYVEAFEVVRMME